MKKVKRKVNRKRIIIVVLIPLICIALLIANFTSIRLSIKGYHKEDKKVVLLQFGCRMKNDQIYKQPKKAC